VRIFLDNRKGNIIHWDYYNIVYMKVMGESYLAINMKISEQYLKEALN
jgi:hypothetical protein